MELILPILFLGLMASMSPATIVVFVLVLGTARPRVNAAAFLVGWGLSLTLVFAGSFALAASGASETEGERTSVSVLEILLGVLLLGVALRLWLRREGPPSSKASGGEGSRLVERMEGLTPAGAAVVGVLKQPWAITTSAALVVVHGHTTGLLDLVAFAVFTVASTATVALMFLYYTRNPAEAGTRLAVLRDQMESAGPAIGALTGLLVGVVLVVHGVRGL